MSGDAPQTPLSAEKIANYRATALLGQRDGTLASSDEVVVELCDSHEALRARVTRVREYLRREADEIERLPWNGHMRARVLHLLRTIGGAHD
jgi:hypothetical protein